MKKNLTELVFILDRSGSMAGLEADTIGGFNAMIDKQRQEAGEALVSTVLFDNETEVIHDRADLQKVPQLTRKEYDLLVLFARNPGTALYRETIYERVWGGDYTGESRTVDLHIQRLRKKVGWEKRLKAVSKVGYRLEL